MSLCPKFSSPDGGDCAEVWPAVRMRQAARAQSQNIEDTAAARQRGADLVRLSPRGAGHGIHQIGGECLMPESGGLHGWLPGGLKDSLCRGLRVLSGSGSGKDLGFSELAGWLRDCLAFLSHLSTLTCLLISSQSSAMAIFTLGLWL